MAHNGGTTQLNFWLPGADKSYPFLNVLKNSGGWFNQFTVLPTINLNSNGYPTASAGSGTIGAIINIPSQTERPGNYVAVWNGNHGINFTTATTVSGSKSSGGRWVFTPASGTNSYTFSPTTFDPFVTPSTDMYICHVDDEAALLSGEIFQTGFINKLLEAPVGVLRFMDVMSTNNTSMSQWAYRTPVSYAFWTGGQYLSGIYCGATTSVGNDYTAALSGFVLADKTAVQLVYNTTASNSTCTLNVNSTGAKPILYRTGQTLFGATLPTANQFNTLIYNAQLGAWLQNGGGSEGGQLLTSNWPPEIMCALCNKINSHAWICIPFLCLDTPSDYALNIATYFKNNLNAGLQAWYEPANEVWNTFGGFNATAYGQIMANFWFGIPTNGWDAWYGKVISQMGQTIWSVYANDTTRFEVIAGMWTLAGPQGGPGSPATGAHERLLSTNYVGIGGVPALPYVTAIAPTTYWNSYSSGVGASSYTTSQILAAAYQYSLTPLQSLADSYMANMPSGVIPTTVYNLWFAFAATYNKKMFAYEGGFSDDYPASNFTGTITAASKAAQCVLTMGTSNTVGPVGSTTTISGISGMTQLNGNTYTIVAVNGQQMTINVDSTAFTTYTSGGTATYVNSQTYVTAFSTACKFAPSLTAWTQKLYTSFTKRGGKFPSCYMFSGNSAVWSVFDPDIYATVHPQWDGIVSFNSNGPSTLYGSPRL